MKTVYPRWRGEHLFDLVDNPTDPGLSPLARGTHISVINRDFRLRFIPAGAGNTPFGGTSRDHWPVYPRWRGEHAAPCQRIILSHGLSPLARGTLRLCDRAYARKRFIPAGAGNTIHPGRYMHLLTVYPRWRGEHCSGDNEYKNDAGLSPLARGTHFITIFINP